MSCTIDERQFLWEKLRLPATHKASLWGYAMLVSASGILDHEMEVMEHRGRVAVS